MVPFFDSDGSAADLELRQRRARRIVDEYVSRRASGGADSTERLLAAHSELRAEILEELDKLAVIDRPSSHGVSDVSTRRGDQSVGLETLLLIRCPHCQTRVEVDNEKSLTTVCCQSCGQKFELVGPRSGAQVPAIVGRFELIEQLGSGSFGAVWRARDLKLDRDVALKTPRRRLSDEQAVEEVLREARVAAQLRHRHIVAIHEVGWESNTPYIVSDLIPGETLDVWARKHPPTFQSSAELCRVIAEALEHAHEAGVIHRDLKPANILIDHGDEPHLTDFGLAKRDGDELTMTADGHLLGTPAYMSPEQARGKAHLCDCRSDVYSLGVILFQLMTGDVPFRGNMSVLPRKIIHDDPPSPRRLNRYVPRDLETICLKCLEKDPGKRYQSALLLADELQRFCRDEPLLARPIGMAGRLWRWRRRQPAMAAWAASTLGLLLFVAALATWGFWHERSMRQRIEETVHSQKNLLLFVRNSDTVQQHWKAVEEAAVDPQLIATLVATTDDVDLQRLRQQVGDESLIAHRRLRQQLLEHPARQPLQDWVVQRFADSDPSKVFAWFVQDEAGVQLARAPIGGDNVGHNYAWRSYFHGGERDYRDLADYRQRGNDARILQTHLSDDFRTEATNEDVVAVSTPVRRGQRFLGVVGVFLYIEPPANRADALPETSP